MVGGYPVSRCEFTTASRSPNLTEVSGTRNSGSVVTLTEGTEAVARLLAASVLGQGCRIGKRTDAAVDQALDVGMDRLHELIVTKLSAERTAALGAETDRRGEFGALTRGQLRTALFTTM